MKNKFSCYYDFLLFSLFMSIFIFKKCGEREREIMKVSECVSDQVNE